MRGGLLLAVVVVVVGGWLLERMSATVGRTTIVWGQWSLEMQTATLLLALLLSGVLFYLCVRLLLSFLGLRQRFARAQEQRRRRAAGQRLTLGLIQLAAGQWDKAEALLVEDVQHSEAPLLNYLTAARAAHMQGRTAQRDELLRQAIASDSAAQIAVGVVRAEMQMVDGQLEQAHATLHNLRTLAPQNRYVLKLFAKTLLRQENWAQLLELLPELQQQGLLDKDSVSMQRLQSATLRGIFAHYAERQQQAQLQAAWGQLPVSIRQQPASQRFYAYALYQCGAHAACTAFIVRAQAGADASPSADALIELYGRLPHDDWAQAVAQAEEWLRVQPDNPVNLLLMGRLCRQQQDWTRALSYYVTSLNQSPNAEAYLELAEMLSGQGDYANARECYRIGLRFSIHAKGERLVIAPADKSTFTSPP